MPSLWADSYVAFDTETTGLGAQARVIEIAAVTFEKGIPVHSWSSLLWPGDSVDWEHPDVKGALEVNQITRKELEGKPSFEEVLPSLLVELSHSVWVAHNAEFDVRMLSQEMRRLDRTLRLPELLVCTRNLSRHTCRKERGHRLADVAPRFDIVPDGAHRAVVDAEVCGKVLWSMVSRGLLPEDGEQLKSILVSYGGR